MNTTYLKKFGVAKTGVAPYDGWTGNENLLVLSDNNGMGYTIREYKKGM